MCSVRSRQDSQAAQQGRVTMETVGANIILTVNCQVRNSCIHHLRSHVISLL